MRLALRGSGSESFAFGQRRHFSLEPRAASERPLAARDWPAEPVSSQLGGFPSRIKTRAANSVIAMISHVFLGISDFERAYAFYAPLAAELGLSLKFCDPNKPWAAWMLPTAPRPLLVIGAPFDGQPSQAGNGQMLALLANDREGVRNAYAVALAHGGTDEGPPGLRPQYHADFYGAYFRDPDGNKLCVCCHEAEAS